MTSPIVGSKRVIGPVRQPGAFPSNVRIGARIEVATSAGGSKVYTSAADPVSVVGFEPGDLWFNTVTGKVFRLEA